MHVTWLQGTGMRPRRAGGRRMVNASGHAVGARRRPIFRPFGRCAAAARIWMLSAMTKITRHLHDTSILRGPVSRLAARTGTILLALAVLAVATAAAIASTGIVRVTKFSARFS